MQYLVAMLVCLTAIASYVNYKFIRLPKTIGLTVLSLGLSLIVIALVSIGQEWVTPLKTLVSGINFSSTVMDGMLSYLLFASALNINALDLSEYKKVVASLATASVFISCVLIGIGVYVLGQILGVELPLIYCLLFGALIAPTDPICVINAMKSTCTPKSIRMKITGESLFNDAAGIVAFVILLHIADGTTHQVDVFHIFLILIQQGIGGILLGYVLGTITAYFLAAVDSHETAILMTLALVTGGYSIATFLGVSGPISMVIAGLVVGNKCRNDYFSQITVYRLYNFWGLVDNVLNSFLFVMIGLEILSIQTGLIPFFLGGMIFFIVILVRLISIIAPFLILERIQAFDWRMLSVMTWGGMRGGLSVALALSLPEGDYKDIIVSITYAVVVFSIIFQGLSLQHLIKWLYPTAPLQKE